MDDHLAGYKVAEQVDLDPVAMPPAPRRPLRTENIQGAEHRQAGCRPDETPGKAVRHDLGPDALFAKQLAQSIAAVLAAGKQHQRPGLAHPVGCLVQQLCFAAAIPVGRPGLQGNQRCVRQRVSGRGQLAQRQQRAGPVQAQAKVIAAEGDLAPLGKRLPFR